MEPPTKKSPRVERLGRDGPRISQSGIAGLLKAVQQHGLPAHFSRATQYRERKKACAEMTPYGPLVRTLLVDNVDVPIQHPAAMLWKISGYDSFQRLLRRGLLEGDLTIIIFSDGISPQDGLSKHDRRKVVAIYWSILQVDDALCDEATWFALTVMRISEVSTISGGLSRLVRDLLRSVFFADASDMRRGLELQDGTLVVVDSVLLDGDIPALSDRTNTLILIIRLCKKCPL